jgi:hypothetical protein
MYNASTCAEMFEILPTCLESIQFAQQAPEWSVERRVAAQNICQKLEKGDTHGTVVEDVRKKASLPMRLPSDSSFDDLYDSQCYSKEPMGCLPLSFNWINDFFRRPENKDALGIPENVNYHTFAEDVTAEFRSYGDM